MSLRRRWFPSGLQQSKRKNVIIEDIGITENIARSFEIANYDLRSFCDRLIIFCFFVAGWIFDFSNSGSNIGYIFVLLGVIGVTFSFIGTVELHGKYLTNRKKLCNMLDLLAVVIFSYVFGIHLANDSVLQKISVILIWLSL